MELNRQPGARLSRWRTLLHWFDTATPVESVGTAQGRKIDWTRVVPFLCLHLACLAVLWVGTSVTAVVTAIALYALRMFAITGFYHRYFSHRAFHTSRLAQFIFALLGASAGQRGPLWWASQHRHHHVHSDQPLDAHSARQHGFLWSHLGWFLARENYPTRHELVKDLAKFPELRWLDRFDTLIPILLGATLFGIGHAMWLWAPGLQTTGLQLVVWGSCVSTVVLYHATFTINSLAHRLGTRRYDTNDDSRNNVWLALLTFGEGWHNNHHHFPGAARQGFFWWEIDVTYAGLKLLNTLGVIRNLRAVPPRMRDATVERAGAQAPLGERI